MNIQVLLEFHEGTVIGTVDKGKVSKISASERIRELVQIQILSIRRTVAMTYHI